MEELNMMGVAPWPFGPLDESHALMARSEVDEEGLLTGGPQTMGEWLDWNRAFAMGQIGRYVMKGTEP